jgi:hypothetical protein
LFLTVSGEALETSDRGMPRHQGNRTGRGKEKSLCPSAVEERSLVKIVGCHIPRQYLH